MRTYVLCDACVCVLSFLRMINAITNSQSVAQVSLKAMVLLEESSKLDTISKMTFTPEESYPRIKVLASHTMVDIKKGGKQVVSFVNSLAHRRVQLVSVLVNSEDVMVSNGCEFSTSYVHNYVCLFMYVRK